MKLPHSPLATAAELRQRAEERLRTAPPIVVGHDEAQRLLHELRVHQVELELQNEELLQSRAALEASAEKYADLYDFAPVSYLALDLGGAIREANLTAATYLGVDRAQLIGQVFTHFLAAESSAQFRDFLEKTATADTKETCEVTLPKKGDPSRRARLEGLAFADGSGEGRHCRLILHDISEHTREAAEIRNLLAASESTRHALLDAIEDLNLTQETLRASESKFRQLAESNILGLMFWNAQGQITDANDAFLKMVGYTREELTSGQIDWRSLTPPEYLPQDERVLAEIAATGSCKPFEKEYFHKDGHRVAVLLGAAALVGAKDRGICYAVDISSSLPARI